jgi:polyhydroxybutyrate depolymerase
VKEEVKMQAALRPGLLAFGFALLIAVPVVSQQAAEDPEAGVESRTIIVDGDERSYHVYRPQGEAKPPYPIVIVLHGGYGQGIRMRRVGFEPVADREGFAVVYPDGNGRGWNDGRLGARIVARCDGADDIAFFDDLIAALVEEGLANPRRIYVTGASNGGIMSYRIACDLSDRVAAVAPVIGNMPADRVELCTPSRSVPVFAINGTEDPLVHYEGGGIGEEPWYIGGKLLSVEYSLVLWRRLNGCTVEHGTRALPDAEPEDQTRTTEMVWNECAGGTEVRLYRVDGGGHTWHGLGRTLPPERLERTGPIGLDFNGAEEIWRFFKRFQLASDPGPRRPRESSSARETGPAPVVFLHGWLMSPFLWSEQLEALCEERRCLAVAQPGHRVPGFDEPYTMTRWAERLHRQLRSSDLEPAVLVGHSMGGMLAMEYARRYPDAVLGLGLVGTTDTPGRPEVVPGIAQQLAGWNEEIATGWASFLIGSSFREANPEWLAEFQDHVARSDREWLPNLMEAIQRRDDLTGFTPTIGVPTTVIHCRSDGAVPFAQGEALAGRIPGAELAAIDDCGHAAPMEQPQATTEALAKLLARVDAELERSGEDPPGDQ